MKKQALEEMKIKKKKNHKKSQKSPSSKLLGINTMVASSIGLDTIEAALSGSHV